MELDKLHESYRHIAMEMFKRATMEKSEVQIAKYGDKLEKEIDVRIDSFRPNLYKRLNYNKRHNCFLTHIF